MCFVCLCFDVSAWCTRQSVFFTNCKPNAALFIPRSVVRISLLMRTFCDKSFIILFHALPMAAKSNRLCQNALRRGFRQRPGERTRVFRESYLEVSESSLSVLFAGWLVLVCVFAFMISIRNELYSGQCQRDRSFKWMADGREGLWSSYHPELLLRNS